MARYPSVLRSSTANRLFTGSNPVRASNKNKRIVLVAQYIEDI